jgi:hypothetical protein
MLRHLCQTGGLAAICKELQQIQHVGNLPDKHDWSFRGVRGHGARNLIV